MKNILFLFLFSIVSVTVFSQTRTRAQQLIFTNEDSLNSGINSSKTVISGYGSAFYQRDFNEQNSMASLERAVLFVGHKFNDKISFFSELELEDAKVEGGDEGGEVAFEQCFVKFNLNPKQYIVAGLFLPRLGLLNENHLPVNFNGVERPITEQIVIPATWREIGVGFYGSANRLPLNYSIALMNGLNSAGFEHGNGIREGRYEGRNASANNLALNASLQYAYKNFKFQLSGYMGGTVGLNKDDADSLGLKGGAFGTPVYLGEGNVQYANKGLSLKLLGAYISLPDAQKINNAYGNGIASGMYGTYAEIAYNWLFKKDAQKQFITFARCEMIDLNASLPNAQKDIYDGAEKQTHIIAGISYLPIPNICIKTDVRLLHTGTQNPLFSEDPSSTFKPNNSFLNIGIGYSF